MGLPTDLEAVVATVTTRPTTTGQRSWRAELAADHQIIQARLQVQIELAGDLEEHL